MPCLIALLVLIAPRLVLLYMWFFTEWFTGMFNGLLWPILGFLFAPTTLIWYSMVQNVWHGTWGTVQIVGLVIAILIDVSPGSRKKRKD